MHKSFHTDNRKALYDQLDDQTILLSFAGKAPRQSADAYYPFFANRNFVYLTGLSGIEPEGFILLACKRGGITEETVFILPPDAHAERWNGRRLTPAEVETMSGIGHILPLDNFEDHFHKIVNRGGLKTLCLDLEKHRPGEPDDAAHAFAKQARERYPQLCVQSYAWRMRSLRTIKKPCEIEAMRKAMTFTEAGIFAMMRGAKPSMYEYEYKALFDQSLTGNGVLSPAFPSIISAGDNNFCIHYYAYTGRSKDGDMILNDVGAVWDNICTDVSRGWPCNGKFSEKQRLLYEAAYETSEHMFGVIRPGMPMADVDRKSHEYCAELLKDLGLIKGYEEVGKLMWHGGAHHVGYDVHDVVDMTQPIEPGMVFCVDIGIYCEEWGIGFRLEDNCLVTENGCENLSASIPRTIEAIEAAMAK